MKLFAKTVAVKENGPAERGHVQRALQASSAGWVGGRTRRPDGYFYQATSPDSASAECTHMNVWRYALKLYQPVPTALIS